MKVHFTGRHVDVSEALKAAAKERLDKMAAYLDDVIDVHVIFSVDSHRHMAETTLKTRRDTFVASTETPDMYKSLSMTMDKLEAQAHKRHDKKVSVAHVPKREAISEVGEAIETVE